MKISERIKYCGGFLILLAYLELENKKLRKGNFCRIDFAQCVVGEWH
ncbi:hypothetical protein [Clostridium perfringens]